MKPIRPRASHFQSVAALTSNRASLAALHADTMVPTAIAQWLGKLKLLEGVPFNYLVPDERMLPAESIRFFQVDLNWIYVLLEGAFSIGRSTSSDAAHDAVFTQKVHAAAHVAAREVRAARPAPGLLPEPMGFQTVRNGTSTTNGVHAQSMGASGTATEQITGFLLRSAVVEGWPGLEVVAYDANSQPINNVLRMERVTPSMLLFLVEGVIDHVDIKEPPEGLHFGVDLGTDTCGERSLRYLAVPPTAPTGTRPGDQIEGATAGAVPCRPGRVLKVDALAAQIETALETLHAITPGSTGHGPPFTSAEFALEMVEGTQRVRFRKV
jgi:hypothetical protein